ncbi:MAG: UDP-N-acetylmuramoyl-L-alanine--D-glutamate ligase [Bacillota bacterium]|nr:UDP-N-acetylmuramoyl-L-alanine--D-glutamate ligase [Bacillota bacterium]
MGRNFEEFKSFIKGKKTAVVGIGISNTPLIYFLKNLGADITAFDMKSLDKLGEIGNQLIKDGIKLELGENYLEKLSGFQVIFKTPSLRIDNPALISAKKEGTYITSEMEEFVRYTKGTVFAVTGSDGKTTTTTLIYEMLKGAGYRTYVGGNIGTPLFSKIEEITEKDMVVLELSSFQLMTMNVPVDTAVVTNLSPNHLDIHKNMKEYIDAKKNVYRYQDENGILILNRDNDITYSMKDEAKGKVLMFSRKEDIENGACLKGDNLTLFGETVCSREDVILPGDHNVENLLAAYLAVHNYVKIEVMKEVSINFKGVEHRQELVRTYKGVKYYNDSIASSPTRTLAGLKSFKKPVILIAGGYDKNIPFDILAEEGIDKVKALILSGNTMESISQAFKRVMKIRNIDLPIFMEDSFSEAVLKAKEIAVPGDIVTLSPACASFDMFKNFEERGRRFKEIVNEF